MRIFLVCFVLIGGTAFFVYQSLNQFNDALDNLSASSLAISKISSVSFSDKKNNEQIPTSTPENISTSTSTLEYISTSTPGIISTSTISTSTPETISTPMTSADLKLSFIFPKKNNGIYAGCTYQLSFYSSTTIHSLEAALIDAGATKTIDPTVSGLTMENKIEPNSQSLDWKVGVVWPGEYYIKVSNINDIDLENYSKVFMIRKMPRGISVDERKKLCKESDGSF